MILTKIKQHLTFNNILFFINGLFLSILFIKDFIKEFPNLKIYEYIDNINLITILYRYNGEMSFIGISLYFLMFFIFVNKTLDFIGKPNFSFNYIKKITGDKVITILMLSALYISIIFGIIHFNSNYESKNPISYGVNIDTEDISDIYIGNINEEKIIVNKTIDYYGKIYNTKIKEYLYIFLGRINEKDFSLDKVNILKNKRVKLIKELNKGEYNGVLYIKKGCSLYPHKKLNNPDIVKTIKPISYESGILKFSNSICNTW